MLGFGGLVLALAGAAGILILRDPGPRHDSTDTMLLAIGLIVPLLVALVVMVLPATRGYSLIWLVTGAWCGFLAALTLFSVGVIFLIAAILLLAAFLRANRANT